MDIAQRHIYEKARTKLASYSFLRRLGLPIDDPVDIFLEEEAIEQVEHYTGAQSPER